ncbi:MAG: response regulator [Flavobacteriales bacterium]|nr:response regulator [Flavobacteriales bacterium]
MEHHRKLKSVLLVDDEREICQLMSNMLRQSGAECTFAHSIQEGKAALNAGRFDAVFLDVHLPDGLGYELIPLLRSSQPKACTITISALDVERSRSEAEGADLFVPKPFNRAIIMSSISSLGFQT